MITQSVIRARVDENVRREAAVVLEAMGLTVSDAMRLLMTRIAVDKRLPFDPLVPNAATVAAMREARAGQLKSFDTIQALLDEIKDSD